MLHKVEFHKAVRLIKETLLLSQIVIGEGVALKKQGREWVGLCPFHDEKTPSFSVNDAKGVYYCRGCHATGDSISFVAEYQGIPVGAAITTLAGRCGITIDRSQDAGRSKGRRPAHAPGPAAVDRLRSLHDAVATLAHSHLLATLAEPDHPVTLYLSSRGISRPMIEQYGLGYLPAGRSLYDLAASSGAHEGLAQAQWSNLASDVGLLTPGRSESMFQGRLLFPIIGQDGRCVALSGRVIPQITPKGSGLESQKYLNSPETPIFSKSEHLFGLVPPAVAMSERESALRWRERLRSSRAVLVEGFTDVLRLASLGVHAVAGMGTAVTASQLTKLFRQVSDITLLMDGDHAGQKALRDALITGFPLLRGDQRLIGRVLPLGVDPDDYFAGAVSGKKDAPWELIGSLEAAHPESVWFERVIGEVSQPVSLADQVRIERAMAGKADIMPPTDPFWRLQLIRYLADRTGYETRPVYPARAGAVSRVEQERMVLSDGDRFWLLRLSRSPKLILEFYRPWAGKWWVRDLRRGLLLAEGECPASLRLIFLAGYCLSRSTEAISNLDALEWPDCVTCLLDQGFPSAWLALWVQVAHRNDPDLVAMGYESEAIAPDLWQWEFEEWVRSIDQNLSDQLRALVALS